MENKQKRVLVVVGTRPEAIKLAPLINTFKSIDGWRPIILATGQHRQLTRMVFDTFDLEPDVDLGLMEDSQTAVQFLHRLLGPLEQHLNAFKPEGVIVQGDTTSAFGAALSAFHMKIPVAHVEAGLRTYNMQAPFPEEMNRILISRLSQVHFAPTVQAEANLMKEGISEDVYVVGNTVVDSLMSISKRLDLGELVVEPQVKELCDVKKKLLLVTFHRRENIETKVGQLCKALEMLASDKDIQILFPLHLNPSVRHPVLKQLGGKKGIHLLPPLDYPSFVYAMRAASLLITDSGGIQEEAPTFSKPVLVVRSCTERIEAKGLSCSTVLSLDDPGILVDRAKALLEACGRILPVSENPFGDGSASKRIAEILVRHWG